MTSSGSGTFTFPTRIGLSIGNTGSGVKTLQEFLQRFGYLRVSSLAEEFPAVRAASSPPEADLETFDEATAIALKRFQKFYGLPVTGILDEATVAQMSLPRCGFPDIPTTEGVSNFVAQGNRWNRNNLTYGFQEFSPELTEQQTKDAIAAALSLWSQVSPLRFTEIPLTSNPDFIIRFVVGDHGDGSPFDGIGDVLAHAFYPPPNGGDIAGDAHFDEAETWTVDIPVPSGGTDFITVAAHEFGHSLGLAHSSVAGALMFPTYSGPHRFLAQDDVDGIRSIYGSGFLVQTGTALHETDQTFEFSLANNGDLFAIKKSQTGSNSTEVHVLSAASNYQQFSLQTGTALHETDQTFEFAVAPNRDVFAIKKSQTGSNSTEVHVLSAASNYQKYSLQTGTALHETDQTFNFAVALNRDVFAIKKSQTESNSTEIHVLSAVGNYQVFSDHVGTALHETDETFAFDVTLGRKLLAVKKSNTETHSTEVHIVDAP